jgi:hypothetical protein
VSDEPRNLAVVDAAAPVATPKLQSSVAVPTMIASSLSDWSLADRGMERRFALRQLATGC